MSDTSAITLDTSTQTLSIYTTDLGMGDSPTKTYTVTIYMITEGGTN